MSPAQTSALATLTPEMNSHGVAIVNTFMQMAASVGSSLFGGIQSVRQASAMADGAAETSAIARCVWTIWSVIIQMGSFKAWMTQINIRKNTEVIHD